MGIAEPHARTYGHVNRMTTVKDVVACHLLKNHNMEGLNERLRGVYFTLTINEGVGQDRHPNEEPSEEE